MKDCVLDLGETLPSQSPQEHGCRYVDLFHETLGGQKISSMTSSNVEQWPEGLQGKTENDPAVGGNPSFLHSSSNSSSLLKPPPCHVADKEAGKGREVWDCEGGGTSRAGDKEEVMSPQRHLQSEGTRTSTSTSTPKTPPKGIVIPALWLFSNISDLISLPLFWQEFFKSKIRVCFEDNLILQSGSSSGGHL